MDKITLVHYPFLGRSLLIRLLCVYGDVEIIEEKVPEESTMKASADLLPLVIVASGREDKKRLERLECIRPVCKSLPNNQVAVRRLAKQMYLLGDSVVENALIDYIVSLCNVDINVVLCAYLSSMNQQANQEQKSSHVPQFRKERMQNALANIESHLRGDGYLFQHQRLTLAELAIFDMSLLLCAVLSDKATQSYPRMKQTIQVVRSHPRLQKAMEEGKGVVSKWEESRRRQVEHLAQLLHLRYKEEEERELMRRRERQKDLEAAALEESGGAAMRRNSVLSAFYAHLSQH